MATNVALGLILIIGGLLIIAFEFYHPGAFLLIPGTVVLAAGFLYVFVPGFLVGSIFGPLFVAFLAVAAALLTIPLYQRLGATHAPMTTTPESLAGSTGVVLAAVYPDSMRGKVRVGSEIWSARSERPIAPGTRVRIERGEGVCVWVEPVDGSGTAR